MKHHSPLPNRYTWQIHRAGQELALYEPTMGGKWLELLSEIAPGLKRAAIMFNPDAISASLFLPSVEAAARSLKVEPSIAPVHSDAEIETAIIASSLLRQNPLALAGAGPGG